MAARAGNWTISASTMAPDPATIGFARRASEDFGCWLSGWMPRVVSFFFWLQYAIGFSLLYKIGFGASQDITPSNPSAMSCCSSWPFSTL
jgi:hypothetical protein